MPSLKRQLRDGDLVNLDVSAELDGYFSDTGVSVAVDEVSRVASRLLEGTELAQYDAMSAAQPGARLRDVGRAVQRRARRHGFRVITNEPVVTAQPPPPEPSTTSLGRGGAPACTETAAARGPGPRSSADTVEGEHPTAPPMAFNGLPASYRRASASASSGVRHHRGLDGGGSRRGAKRRLLKRSAELRDRSCSPRSES